MTSSPLDYTHSRRMSGVACHHRLWRAQTVGRRQAWHAITALGLADTVRRRQAWYATTAIRRQIQLNDIGLGMPSTPLDSTHGRTMSGVACHHRPWTANTVGNVRRGMTSPPLDSTHGRMTSGVAYHHSPWRENTVGRRRAWNVIIAFGQHTRSNDVRRGMPSWPLDTTHG